MKRTTGLLLAVAMLAAGPVVAQENPAADPAPPAAAPDIAAAAPAPQAWEHVQVTTSDGWHLDDVTLQWLADGSRVRVTRADGSWRDYDPWTVSAVHAADGADLTATIAAARPGGTAAAPPSPRRRGSSFSEIPTEDILPADDGPGDGLAGGLGGPPPFAVAATVGGGYAGYAGDWFEGFEAAPSLQGCVRIGTGARNWVTIGYRRQGGGSVLLTGYDFDLNPISVDIDLRIDEYVVMIGMCPRQRSLNRNVPYTEFGIAVLNHVATADVAGLGSASDSETKLGAILQLGGLFALGKNGVMDLGVDVVHKPGIFSDDEAGGTVFGAHVGFGYIGW